MTEPAEHVGVAGASGGVVRVISLAKAGAAIFTRVLPSLLRVVLPFPVAWIFLTDPGINGFFGSRFEDAVHGRSFQPYVYRALIPWIVGSLTDMAEGARPWAAELFNASVVLTLLRKTARVSAARSLELGIFALLTVVLLQVFAGSLRRACRRLYDAPPLFAEVLPVAALVLLPCLFSYNNYVYDPGTIVFSALALELLVRRRWWLFVAVVSLAFYNKETIVLFVPLFALHAFREVPARRYAVMLAVLGAGFVASRVILNALFAKHLGMYTIPQLVEHNLKLLRSYPIAVVVPWIVLAVALFGHWSQKPRVLKVGLFCHLPLFGACLLWGYFDELRDYYEVYPMLLLAMAPTVAKAMGHEIHSRDAAASGTTRA